MADFVSGSIVDYNGTYWTSALASVINILGATGVVFPFGDPLYGLSDAATFVTAGAETFTCTPSTPIDSWDTPFDQTDYDQYQGVVPFLTFNGTDEYITTPDAAFWTGGDAATDNAFSVGAWINMVDATKFRIVGKGDDPSPLEWLLTSSGTDFYVFVCYDNTAAPDNQLTSTIDTSATADEGKDIFIVATYDGSSTAAGVTMYRNGIAPAQTKVKGATYVAMHDSGGLPSIGAWTPGTDTFANGKIYGGPLGPFFAQRVLTADEVLRLYHLGKKMLEIV